MGSSRKKASTGKIMVDGFLNQRKRGVSSDIFLLHTPEDITVGDRVQILWPEYVAGQEGVVCGREILPGGQPSNRWLAQVDLEDIVVSLTPEEFQVLSSGRKSPSVKSQYRKSIQGG